MKKNLIMLLAAALLVVAGCKKDDKNANGEKMIFSAGFDNGSTKTEIHDLDMNWTEGDVVTINGKVFTADQSDETTNLVGSTVEKDDKGLYKAYFPSNICEGNSLVLPSTQTYSGSNNLSGVNPMYAQSDETSLTFHNICALVRLDVTGVGKVKTIVAKANEALSGAFTIEGNEEEGFYANLTSKDAAGVTLDCGDGISLDGSNPTSFYIALPKGNFTNLSFTISDGIKTSEVNLGNQALEAGKLYTAKGNFTAKGAISGLFTIGKGKQVYFSQGNLQYVGSTSTWQFATNQFEFLGNNGQGSSSLTVNRDLFGWGDLTGCNTSKDNGQYQWTDDWGTNPISNGGGSVWRTLQENEWNTLIARSAELYGKGSVGKGSVDGSKTGIILLPDNWDWSEITLPDPQVTWMPGPQDNWPNAYTPEQWGKLEDAGAVFLPTAGDRDVYKVENLSIGRYWLSTPSSSNVSQARHFKFYTSGKRIEIEDGSKHLGYSVRLVSDK